MGQRAVFLDRDGAINEEVEYLTRADQLKLIGGAAEAIRLLNKAGFKIVVITNQSAIARGYLKEEDLPAIHAEMEKMLRKGKARVDAIYYCPHHPTLGIGPYKTDCPCRKPKPGMLQQAAADLGLDLQSSFVIGDKMSDLGAGEAAGCRKILVRTGYGAEMEQRLQNYPFRPDYIADDLLEAAKWILSQGKNQGRVARVLEPA